MRKFTLLSLCVCISLGSEVFNLGTIEVTDNKYDPQILIIDKQDLNTQNITNISNLAKTQPGLYFEKRGGRNDSTIKIRGFDSKRIGIF